MLRGESKFPISLWRIVTEFASEVHLRLMKPTGVGQREGARYTGGGARKAYQAFIATSALDTLEKTPVSEWRCAGRGKAQGEFMDQTMLLRLQPEPESFQCPTSTEIMDDPVATIDGCVYDRRSKEVP